MKKLIFVCYGFICLISCQKEPQWIGFSYPDGKYKALVLSYDDGTIQDRELVHLLDQNQLVGTFNLNSGYLGEIRGWPQKDGDTIFQEYVSKDSLLSLYKNHEIAVHGALHKDFTAIPHKEVLQEVQTDLEVLTQLTNRKIISSAYPFGNTNDSIAALMATTGILNGRSVADTYRFDLPDNYMIWNPTCHDSKALDYLNPYLALNKQELSLFYVWGHSWEFGDAKRWENMVEFCTKIGKANDIWFVGNGALTQYLQALDKVQLEAHRISNPTGNEEVWVHLSSGIKKLNGGESMALHPKTKKPVQN